MSKNNRRKGHAYERELAKTFRELGYDKVKTSREASRLYDNCGIDLWGLPFLIQAKAGYKANRIKPDVLFHNIRENIEKNFPKEEVELLNSYPILIFNKLDGYKKEHHFVTLKYHDFVRMMIEFNLLKGLIPPDKAEEIYGKLL
jgi:hypothetical protein